MLWIEQGTTNILITTLTEKSVTHGLYFLLRVRNEVTNEETSCIVTDSSTHPARYNELHVTETSGADGTAAEIYLPITGRYYYWIYEQDSDTNLDYTLADTLLEKGFLEVTGSEPTITTYDSATTQKTVYNG